MKTKKHPKNERYWKTCSEAENHGWVTPHSADIYLRDGLYVRDVSGPNWFGYDFAVIDIATDKELLTTTTLWYSDEKNQIGKIGAFDPRFHITDLRRLRPSKAGKKKALSLKIDELKQEIEKLESMRNAL
jgi:hypothetical protein